MPTPDAPARVLLSTVSLAARWGVTAGGLANLRSQGAGLPFLKIPGVGIRYDLTHVEAHEAAHAVTPGEGA